MKKEKNKKNRSKKTDASADTKKTNSTIRFFIWIAVALAISLGTFFFTTNFIVRWPIIGTSMCPTIQNNDDVLVFKTKKINYDDVIIFFSPEIHQDGDHLIKRVIGKPGDEIAIKFDQENNVYHIQRNGELLSESKIYAPMTPMGGWSEKTVIVPEGKYYVLGDNRNASTDSSEGIYADEKNIVGVVFFRISESHSIGIVR